MSDNIDALTLKLLHETPENVHSVGYGYKEVNGQLTDELSIIFNLVEKKPLSAVPLNEILPNTVIDDNGVEYKTDVVESSPLSAMYCYTPSNTTPPVSLHRASQSPFLGGIQMSIDAVGQPGFIEVGTIGCICLDTSDNTLVALTNAHVAVPATRNAGYAGYTSSFNNRQTACYQAAPGSFNTTMRLKRYMPFSSSSNTIDAAVVAITDPNQINTSSSFRQLNLNYGNLEFASTSEINNLVVDRNPIFKGGRTTGPVGWPGSSPWGSAACSLTATQTNVSTGVTFTDYTGTYTVPFSNCFYFRGTNTISIDRGDSGSAVCALINPDSPTLSAWKIVGIAFAGGTAANNNIALACRIDNICTTMQLTSWDGQTTALTNLNNESLEFLPGRASTPFFDKNNKRYWQTSITVL